jgi:UDP-GlcNAc:undecaprenyl-phosphate GlcNAc-1-phosphate transferase
MPDSLALSILLLAFLASVTFNGFFRSIAKNNNILIDIPDKSRKFHIRATPLTGGFGIFFGIIISGILVTGLSGANYSLDLSNKGFFADTELNKRSISRNFEVDNEDYALSLNKTNDNEILVKINSELNSDTVEIIALSKNKFKAILPNGQEKLYIVDSGDVIELSKSNEAIEIFSPLSTDKINLNNFSISLYLCALFIMIFMFFDDIMGIKASYRIIFQCLIVVLMIIMSGEYLDQVGDLFGFGEISLGLLSIPFTIFCVVGLMNAFNMIDGLNGICASLALIPIMYVTYLGNFSYGLLIPIGAILGFLAYNLGFLGKKRRVFLGDSGSNMLGFAVGFICIEYSQNINHESYINPVTALWLVALPLIDCITVMLSRSLKGIMPFRPGRDHLHHRLLDLGMKPKRILLIFILTSIVLALFGFILEINFPEKEYISFFAFLVLSFTYYFTSRKNIAHV